jgi:superfamily II DNA or RNA helicase
LIIDIDCNDLADYTMFLKARGLPRYEIKGRRVIVPDDLRHLIDGSKVEQSNEYAAPTWMFDYQAAIVSRAIAQKKFAVFADCGLGKTAILLEFARHAWSAGKRTLIVSPLMVINQTIDEADQFFGDSLPMKRVKSSDLQSWLDAEGYQSVGITNYEAMRDIDPTSRVDCLILDESSILKSHYGKAG